jgi:LysM repeat protein
MKINRYLLAFFCLLFFSSTHVLFAQTQNRAYVEYIEQYSDLAVKHMELYQIPASITLAQGILESGAGKSPLAKENNNHFGIKSTSDWKGDRVIHFDDGQDTYFRAYKNASDSYTDHSRFIAERQRYSALFFLDPTDYKGWAKGLQDLGYATDKTYANKLIKIIEDYELYCYDTGLQVGTPNKSQARLPAITRRVFKMYGLAYVVANAGDSFDNIASDLKLNSKDLIKFNEVPPNFSLHKGDVVYLQKKKKKANKPYLDHQVRVGESMYSISQKYGMQLGCLYKLNKKSGNYIPTEGDVLKLR